MRRRRLWIALAVLLLAAVIALLVYLRSRAAPEAARLLPEADAVLFVNLRVMRVASVFGQPPPISYDPDYEEFVKQTGFQFERDLDQAAFAVHASGSALNPGAPAGAFLENAHYSEIFIGHFDGQRAAAYFGKLASGVESYGDIPIYTIPHEGRTVRVAILGVGTAAVSNVPDAGVIHEMIDKYRAAARPLSGPSLVRSYYREVPFGSLAWGITKLPAGAEARSLRLPGGVELPSNWLAGTVLVASARYLRALHLKVAALTASETNAKQILETTQTFLTLLRSVESNAPGGGADQDVKTFFDSIKVEQHGAQVDLTATVPHGFIRKALTPPPSPAATPPAAPAKPEKRKKGR